MKYLIALGLSAMLFLGMIRPTIDIKFWNKVLYNKEESKEKTKKEYKISLILWALGTIAIFIFVAFFAKE